MNLDRQHARFVQQLVSSGMLVSPRILAAFQTVRRHDFLPEALRPHAYEDHAIAVKTKCGLRGGKECVSSSTQPSLMAMMLELLAPDRGMHVLEIGTGTGFNAALLAEVVGPDGRVISVDIDPELTDTARTHLRAYDGLRLFTADAMDHLPCNDLLDAVIVTASAPDFPAHWMRALKPCGRVVVPMYVAGVDYLFAGTKTEQGSIDGSFSTLTIFTGLDESVRNPLKTFDIEAMVLYDAMTFLHTPDPSKAHEWLVDGPSITNFEGFESDHAAEGFHVWTNLSRCFDGQGMQTAYSEGTAFGFSGYGFYAWSDKGLIVYPLRPGIRRLIGLGDATRLVGQFETAYDSWSLQRRPGLGDYLFRLGFGESDKTTRAIPMRTSYLKCVEITGRTHHHT